MNKKIALEEIMLYDALRRWDTWYLEKKNGHLSFITAEERESGVSKLSDEEYIECPFCGPYMAKEYITSRQFERNLLEQYEIDISLDINKYSDRRCLDERIIAFAYNVGRMCHDLGLISDYREFCRPLMGKLAKEWLSQISF